MKEFDDSIQHDVYEVGFLPKYFSDAPPIFEIPSTCPGHIRRATRAAFQVFWSDPDACANRIRAVVELLLTQPALTILSSAAESVRNNDMTASAKSFERALLGVETIDVVTITGARTLEKARRENALGCFRRRMISDRASLLWRPQRGSN